MPEVNMFEYLVKKLGTPSDAIMLSEERLQEYENILPPWLLEFWREYGIGSYRDGAFGFVIRRLFGLPSTKFFW